MATTKTDVRIGQIFHTSIIDVSYNIFFASYCYDTSFCWFYNIFPVSAGLIFKQHDIEAIFCQTVISMLLNKHFLSPSSLF